MLPTIIGIIAVAFLLVLLVGCPAWEKAWGKLVRLDCLTNLKNIGVVCREYADEHGGHFPSTWVELNLTGEKANWAKLFRCPSTRHEVGMWPQVDLWSDYRLLPGRTTNDPPDRILALEPLANHGSDGANVLFVDGSTQWWPALRLLGSADGMSTNIVLK